MTTHFLLESSATPIWVVLPLIDKIQASRIEKYIPVEVLPNGFKDLALIALENPSDYEKYIDACYVLFDICVDQMSNSDHCLSAGYYWDLLTNEDSAELISVGLLDFHKCFIQKTKALMGGRLPKLKRVISYRVNEAICVEFRKTGDYPYE